MNKKTQKQAKQSNNLSKFLAKNNTSHDKSSTPPIQKNQGKKKINPPASNPQAHKDKPAPTPLLTKALQLQHLLKEIQIEEVLTKCPKLSQLVLSLASKLSLAREIVIAVLKKYLHSSPLSLWSRRYAPKQISELFNVAAGIKIKEWIDAFFEYKNKIIEEDSFINDIESQKSCTIYRKIRENQWQLQALIVRGRPGIGKTSAIRAVANEMDIDLQQCGNQYNHIKYLKEKNESTQSQSVKTAYIRKPKIEKNAQMITKFISFVQKQKPKENKKSQMIHNISKIFPESQASKFYSELSKCVQFSKIPFIMTNSGEKLPKECERYDLIQFDSGHTQLIQTFLWLIYHLECLICLNKRVQIQKDSLFQQMNNQVALLEFKQLCPISKIREICELFNYRLDYIFTFLQHEKANLNGVEIFPLMVQKYKQLNEDQLLEEILFIDFERLKISRPLRHPIVKEKSQKMEDHNNTQDSSQSQKIKDEKQYSLDTYRRMIKLAAIEDTLVRNKLGIHMESNSQDLSQWQDYPYTCIDVNVHRGIKVSLAKMANTEINTSHQKLRSSLQPSELYYLPMMIREKRANRSSRISIDGLKKVYDANELCYLQNFGHLIRQQ